MAAKLPRPRLPIHELLNPEFGVTSDVTLLVLNRAGEVEGELKAHGNILALSSSVLKELLFTKSGEFNARKLVEVRGATLKTAKWMLDFIYWKPSEDFGWDDASAEEIFQLASLADQFQLIELQDRAEVMLSALPLEKEDILEVASIALHFEVPFPTASKALLDKCISLLVSTMHTAEDVARFARLASKDTQLAPLVLRLLSGMDSCKKVPVLTEKKVESIEEDIMQADVIKKTREGCGSKCGIAKECEESKGDAMPIQGRSYGSQVKSPGGPSKVRPGDGDCSKKCSNLNFSSRIEGNGTLPDGDAYILARFKKYGVAVFSSKTRHKDGDWNCNHCGNFNFQFRDECNKCGLSKLDAPSDSFKNLIEKKKELCPNCKLTKKGCVNGIEVRYIRPKGKQVGCKVVTHGPHWSEKSRGLVATVVEALDFETVKVRWDWEVEADRGTGTGKRNVGSLTTYKLFSTLEHAKGKSLFKFSCS